jgi:DNA helicase-2/ATP-dependent DNA helicase PcrA
LRRILEPFEPLVHEGAPRLSVAAPAKQKEVLETALRAARVFEDPVYLTNAITRIRRSLALGGDVSGEDDRYIDAARIYDRLLADADLVDFESMVLRAHWLLDRNPDLRNILAARYPWLLVDEYQDLGEPLHRIALLQASGGRSRIFAVGDPDQSIYAFQGADPRFMLELQTEHGFDVFRLGFNYRSGSRLIAASQAALQEDREYAPDPTNQDAGEVFVDDVPGGIGAQANHVTRQVLPSLAERGIPAEDIAILYPKRGNLLTHLRASLDDAGIDYVWERDERMPGGRVGQWLQRCARRAIDGDAEGAELLHELSWDLAVWLDQEDDNERDLLALRHISALVTSGQTPGIQLGRWLRDTEAIVALRGQLASQGNADDLEEYEDLLAQSQESELGELPLSDYANPSRKAGRVVLTTYHGSKGREFSAVILPGLQEQLMPAGRWNRAARRWELTDVDLSEQRRLFYVAFTRARTAVVLVSSASALNDKNYAIPRSRFVGEIQRQLLS